MNKKQEIEKEITRKEKLILTKLEQKHQILRLMSGYEEDIFELKQQLKECDELKLEPFDYYIDVGIQYIFNIPSNSMQRFEHGVCYETVELAEIAMRNSNIRNKLEAYSRMIDPDWREVWEGMHINYYIWFYVESGEYKVESAMYTKQLGTVYMSRKAANRIVQALNKKEITI